MWNIGSKSEAIIPTLMTNRGVPPSEQNYISRYYKFNSTLAGVSSHLLSRLQLVINAAAQLIFSSSKFQHITPLLR